MGIYSAAQVDANLQATDYRLDPELLAEVDLTVSSVRGWTGIPAGPKITINSTLMQSFDRPPTDSLRYSPK